MPPPPSPPPPAKTSYYADADYHHPQGGGKLFSFPGQHFFENLFPNRKGLEETTNNATKSRVKLFISFLY